MKRILAALVVTLMLAGSAAANQILRFAWEYDAVAAPMIDGFRLYQDGQRMTLTIPKTARTVDTPHIVDFNSHTYHLTAFKGTDESVPSAIVTVPAYFGAVPSVIEGTFRFEIIKVTP